MTIQEQIALVSAVVAGTSLAANLIMGIAIYKLNRSNLKRNEVWDVLRSLLYRLDSSRLFEMDPEQEIWHFGFERLRELALACPPAKLVAQTSRFVTSEVRTLVPQLSDHVKRLRAFQDSWRSFSSGKGDDADWRSVQRDWPDIERATAALEAAQPVAAQCKAALSSLLAQP